MNKFNLKRLLIALVVGIVVLNIVSPFQEMSDSWFDAYVGVPSEMVVQKSIGLWVVQVFLNVVVFQVLIPMCFYVFLSEIAIQKSNILIGVIFGVTCFFVGSLSQLVMLPLLIHMPINFVAIRSFWALINLVLAGGIIGGIYKPVAKKKPVPSNEEKGAV
jgi:hypothetical protein